MSESKKDEPSNEIESLNLEEMDIEELEHRLELAAAGCADGGHCYLYTDRS
jgi:CRISPR/Cas system-associated protein Csx1